MTTPTYLYDIKPDDYEKYAEMIMRDLDFFITEHIQKEMTMRKRQKNLAWLLNWIGQDCYQHLINPKDSPKKKECEDRRDFIRDKYANKKETKPFLDIGESSAYLSENKNNPDAAFVSRLSSTIPGELTIQHIEEDKNEALARRFNYKTQRSSPTKNNPNEEFIDDYLKNLIQRKNEYIQKHNLQKKRPIYDKTKVQNYYSDTKKSPKKQQIFEEEEISFQPYETVEDIPEPKKGTYLTTGEFTKRANRGAKMYDHSTLDQQFLKFK